MSDIADILGVEGSPAGKSAEEGVKSLLDRSRSSRLAVAARKLPEGMSREVFSLTDTWAPPPPSLAADLSVNTGFKQKKTFNGPVAWEWKSFRNSARTDNLQLKHWARVNDTRPDYAFARFNKKIEMVRYTDKEYELYCQDTRWTREMTDHLFDLCSRFDLRFVIVHDRFEYTGFTIEDLKDRYYSIAKKLLLATAATNPNVNEHPLVKHSYDKVYEERRRQQMERLYARTRQQELEELYLISEMQVINKEQKKNEKENQRARKLLSSGAGARSTKGESSAAGGTPAAAPSRKRKLAAAAGGPGGSARPEDGGEGGSGAAAQGDDADDEPARKKGRVKKAGAYMRSTKLMTPLACGNKMAKRVDQFLDDLQIPRRPMASAPVTDTYNDLRKEALHLLELQKALAKRLYEVEALRARRQQLGGVTYVQRHTLHTPSVGAAITAGTFGDDDGAPAAGSSRPSSGNASLSEQVRLAQAQAQAYAEQRQRERGGV